MGRKRTPDCNERVPLEPDRWCAFCQHLPGSKSKKFRKQLKNKKNTVPDSLSPRPPGCELASSQPPPEPAHRSRKRRAIVHVRQIIGLPTDGTFEPQPTEAAADAPAAQSKLRTNRRQTVMFYPGEEMRARDRMASRPHDPETGEPVVAWNAKICPLLRQTKFSASAFATPTQKTRTEAATMSICTTSGSPSQHPTLPITASLHHHRASSCVVSCAHLNG